MAKIAQHFTVTKHLINGARIEFSGIVYNKDHEHYDIETVHFHTIDPLKQEVTEDITQWFHSFREITNPEFHHEDISNLLLEWLQSDEAKTNIHRLKDAA